MNLIHISSLRAVCSSFGIDYVTQKENTLSMRFSISAEIDMLRVLTAVRRHPEITVLGGNPPILRFTGKSAAPEALLQEAIAVMRTVQKEFLEMGKNGEKLPEANA